MVRDALDQPLWQWVDPIQMGPPVEMPKSYLDTNCNTGTTFILLPSTVSLHRVV